MVVITCYVYWLQNLVYYEFVWLYLFNCLPIMLVDKMSQTSQEEEYQSSFGSSPSISADPLLRLFGQLLSTSMQVLIFDLTPSTI